MRVLMVTLGLAVILIGQTNGQSTKEVFGKNRIQHKNLEWRYFSSENFDIYFYDGGEENARLATEFMEEDFNRITDVLGYAPYAKTKIFIYNSPTDLQQSNKGLYEVPFTIGGQTNFVKLQVEIAYPGTMEGFKRELLFKTTQLLINDMMFGGSLSDMFQSAYLLSLPAWFMDGAAFYIAYGWDIRMDDYVRDYFQNKKFKKLKRLSGEEAKLLGQSIWNFIAIKHGRSNISNVLNLTRIIRNEENSIASTLGVPFKQFLINWQSYYVETGASAISNYVPPSPDDQVIKRVNDYKFNQVKISPDGKRMAYSVNDNGRYGVRVRNLETGKEKKIITKGYRLINQEYDEEMPLLSWIDETTLGIVDTYQGFLQVSQYNILNKVTVTKPLIKFNQIKDIGFNDNGRLAVVSADINGANDLFLISLRRNAIRRLTNDIYDDINPKFLPGTDAIIFSSNRLIDSLVVSDAAFKDIDDNFNLFLYDLDTTENIVVRLTNTLSKDVNPKPIDSNTIFYLSDQKGITNIYKYVISDNIFTQVTNFNTSVENFDIIEAGSGLAFSLLNSGEHKLYYSSDFDRNKSAFTPQTVRQDIEQAKFVTNRLNQRLKEEPDVPDTTSFFAVDSLFVEEQIVSTLPDSLTNLEEYIDTDNYVFEEEVEDEVEEEIQTQSFLSNFRQFQEQSEIVGPNPYETRFSAQSIVTSFVIDPLRGFGILLETQMNDLLEDQRFYGGVLAVSDLRSGDFFGEYELLKYKLDLGIRYDRKSIIHDKGDRRPSSQGGTEIPSLQKYILNKLEFGGSLPLTTTSRLVFRPFLATTRYLELAEGTISIAAPTGPDVVDSFTGFRLEFVFDNSLTKGLNVYEGTRAKIGFHQWAGISNGQKSYGKFFVDLRHHQKIHREISLALRGYYGNFFGNNAPQFLLGGMNNWLFNGTVKKGDLDPLRGETNVDNGNILFHEYVPLRGYKYDKFNGNNVMTFSAELRIPIIRYIMRGPIQSNFFRNLMFVGFYDVGSAWTGVSPFKEENSVNTVTVKNPGSPFQATLRNSQSPWLASAGFGLRTVMLGYYMKFDFAKPIENFELGKLKFYLTLGHKF